MTDNSLTGGGWKNPPSESIQKFLKGAKTIAIVGLSPKAERPSNGVASYLLDQGYKIIPVNPGFKEILGQKSYPALADIPETIDIVDLFRKSKFVMPIVNEAISIGVKTVWLQESVLSEEAFKKGQKAGLMMIMDRCILKEHRRLI